MKKISLLFFFALMGFQGIAFGQSLTCHDHKGKEVTDLNGSCCSSHFYKVETGKDPECPKGQVCGGDGKNEPAQCCTKLCGVICCNEGEKCCNEKCCAGACCEGKCCAAGE